MPPTETEAVARTGLFARKSVRLAACVVALALSPLCLEGLLRFAGLFVEGSRAGAAGKAEILCQGDSFTFGIYLPPEASYPARLEALLREHGQDSERVVNAGIPSKPTWVLRQELRADLRRWKPRTVLMLAGLNDHWRSRPSDYAVELPGPAPRPWRIVKLWQLLTASKQAPRTESLTDDREEEASVADGEPGPSAPAGESEIRNWIPTTAVKARPGVQRVRFRDRDGGMRGFDILAGAPSDSECSAWIEEDLTAAIRIAREEGVVPILLAYPAKGGLFESTNAALERVATATATQFIDARREFIHGMGSAGFEALFFPDSHLSALGCTLLARVVLRELALSGSVDVESVPPPIAVLEGWTHPELSASVEPAAPGRRPSHLRVGYAPGYGAVVFLARARGSTVVDFPELGSVQRVEVAGEKSRSLPLADDALLEATLAKNELRTVTLDTDGQALVPIPWEAAGALADGETVYAAVAVVLPKVGPVLTVSEPFPLAASKE